VFCGELKLYRMGEGLTTSMVEADVGIQHGATRRWRLRIVVNDENTRSI
jgi:hypothetical protein